MVVKKIYLLVLISLLFPQVCSGAYFSYIPTVQVDTEADKEKARITAKQQKLRIKKLLGIEKIRVEAKKLVDENLALKNNLLSEKERLKTLISQWNSKNAELNSKIEKYKEDINKLTIEKNHVQSRSDIFSTGLYVTIIWIVLSFMRFFYRRPMAKLEKEKISKEIQSLSLHITSSENQVGGINK